MKKPLPIGVDDFKKLITSGYYYVDKTLFIKELLDKKGDVNLFTRPRRFGKTLNMSMLKYFFEIGTNCALFDGLYISRNQTLCREHMAGYPVIFITLKNVDGLSFEEAKCQFMDVIGSEASRFRFLLDSQNLAPEDKEQYQAIITMKSGAYWMSEPVLSRSLKTLSELLNKHYQKKALILIDEYDVPLDKSFLHGYYREMVSLMRILFGNVLKTNDALQFAVLTGCLRVSKESIFTGLNNFKILSITDSRFDEQFGFTDMEVKQLLKDYHLEQRFEETKQWYDGYHFGNADVYCPWDVINHVDRIKDDPAARPESYWINTSGNELVKRFIDKAGKTTRNEIERLIAGETIKKEIHQELTYQDMYSSIENLWSVLFTTGYLTQRGKPEKKLFSLAIPNMEIREIFTEQIMTLFKEDIRKNRETVDDFCRALQEGNAEEVEKQFSQFLKKTISIRDTFVKKQLKENFYHGILLGILGSYHAWIVSSNREAGDGYSDILLYMDEEELGIVIEVKYAQNGRLEEGCREALEQIEANRYEEALREEGAEHILKYGIACYKKRCRVILANEAE